MTDAHQKIPIRVLIVPSITTPIDNNKLQDIRRLPYLRVLKFAHPVTADNSIKMSLLIVAEHYWDVVEDMIINGNGPTALKSKIGYLLSGPITDTRCLLQVTAYVLRFVTTCKEYEQSRNVGPLSANELREAEKICLCGCQVIAFLDKLSSLKSVSSQLTLVKQLCLILDDSGCIWCGGESIMQVLTTLPNFPTSYPWSTTWPELNSGSLLSDRLSTLLSGFASDVDVLMVNLTDHKTNLHYLKCEVKNPDL